MKKLIEADFSCLPHGKNLEETLKYYKLPLVPPPPAA